MSGGVEVDSPWRHSPVLKASHLGAWESTNLNRSSPALRPAALCAKQLALREAV
jgi:hypothetical protein